MGGAGRTTLRCRAAGDPPGASGGDNGELTWDWDQTRGRSTFRERLALPKGDRGKPRYARAAGGMGEVA